MRRDARAWADSEVDCSGKRAPYAPKWTANLAAERTFTLAQRRRELVADARLHYQTEMLTGLDFTPLEYQDAYFTLGASVTYATRGDRYYLTAFGTNLTDETVVANSVPAAVRPVCRRHVAAASPVRPAPRRALLIDDGVRLPFALRRVTASPPRGGSAAVQTQLLLRRGETAM